MTKRMILMLIAVVIILGGIFGYKMYQGKKFAQMMMAGGMPAQTVSTIKAAFEDWQPNLTAVGTVHAINGADLSSELSGIVESIDFQSDTDVEAGAPLIHLRAEDDIAKLHSLQAVARLDEITLDRDQKQLKAQAVSQAVVDNDNANFANATAQVAEQQAIVDKKIIRAPFKGHVGIRQVNLGQYLNPGTAVVSLQQLDPIYIDFTLPEQALSQLQNGAKVVGKIDGNDTGFEGQITAINSRIDEATRNIQVRATFKNTDNKMLPGMFAHVNLDVGTSQRYITLPQTSISFNPYGSTVYVVDKDDKGKLVAKQVFVTTGETRGDQIAILSGISEGDVIVTSGQVKLRNGMPVNVNNDVLPSNDPNPAPHEQ